MFTAQLAFALVLIGGPDPQADPDGARLKAGETCFAIELNGQVMGATRQVVRAAEHEGRPAWRIEIHQRLPALQFDVRDTFLVDRRDLTAIRYESDRTASDRAPAQQVRITYGPESVSGSKTVGETSTPISERVDGPVHDGNLWGLTFSGLDLHEGARHTVPFWHYDKGLGTFTVAVVGSRVVETPDASVPAWVLEVGDGSGRTTSYLIAKANHAELGYSAGPFAQRLGGDCSGFPA